MTLERQTNKAVDDCRRTLTALDMADNLDDKIKQTIKAQKHLANAKDCLRRMQKQEAKGLADFLNANSKGID